MDRRFRKLFEPIQIGKVTVPNRIYMPSMCTNYAGPNGESTIQDIGYYEARARGGAGLICIDIPAISLEGRVMMGQRGLWSDELMPHFTRLVDAIKARGVRVTTQIHHGGVNAAVVPPVGPSFVSNKEFMVSKPRELSTDEVERIVEQFADAALRGKTCGLDMVEVHGTHGYLVSEFISPFFNRRTDKYGRDKALFAIEIVRRIKEKCGADFPVIFRFNADELTPEGITLEYAKEIAKRLESAGVDLLNVTGANYDTMDYQVPNMYLEDEEETEYYRFVKFASEIKKTVTIPVMSGGLLIDPLIAERVLEDGLVDMVFIGRQLIADPEWPNKVLKGRLEDIRPCCHCMDGCIGRIFFNKTLWCSVNPMTGYEYRWADEQTLPKPARNKRVVIVGAGPAGLEAARICAIRGHEVLIIDKNDKMGGTAIVASVPSFKKGHRKLIEWYKRQLEKLHVEVQLNTEVTTTFINGKKPDAIILATGSKPVIPDISGIKQAVFADDVLLGRKETGQNVVIIGGGFVGLDTALWLAKQGKKVTVVEALMEAGADIETPLVRLSFFRKHGGLLDKYDIKVLTGSPVIAVRADGVETVDCLGCRSFHKADTVICAVGRCSVLDSELSYTVEEVYIIGDAREPRKIIDAIHEGFIVALDI